MSDAAVSPSPVATPATTPASPAAAPTTSTAVAPAEGTPAPASPAEGAAETTEPKVEKVEPKEFVALKREKAKLHEAQQTLKREKQQVEQAMSAIVAPVRQALDKFDDEPLAALEFIARAKGKSVQEVFDAIIIGAKTHGDPPDPNDRVSKLERQIAEKEAADKKAAEERAAAIAEQENAAFESDLAGRLNHYIGTNAERFEHLALRGESSGAALIKLSKQWYAQHGEQLSAEQAAEMLETQLHEQYEEHLANRLSKSKKLSKWFAPPQPAPTSEPAAPENKTATPTMANAAEPPPAGNRPLPVRTINSRQAAVPAGVTRVIRKPSSDREIIERAAALLPAKYQQRS